MEIHLGSADRRSLSAEIYRQVREAILDGRLRSGERLPPTRELARGLQVARSTVTVAYERLLGEGFVTSRVGSGTFVSRHLSPPRRRTPRRVGGPLTARPVWDTIAPTTAFARAARYDFRCGLPDASLFPLQTWRRVVARELRHDAIAGIYGDPAGDPRLRLAIARHVGVSRGVHASADDLTITNGTQQAVDVVARALVEPGDHIAVEDPGYPPVRQLLTSLGARVHGVPVDSEGIVVEAIGPRARLVYVTPSHQFPLGVAMSLRRRLALLAWADRHDAAIVEDDYDSEFRFYDRPIEPLKSLDDRGRVVYVGSFSKTMLPTLRLGFVLSPPSVTPAMHAAKFMADWHTSLPEQRALASFIDEGDLSRHLRRMSGVYRVRHERLLDAVDRLLGEHLEVIPSPAGLHVGTVARAASVERVQAVADAAMEDGVAVQTLARYRFEQPPRAGLALGYGAIEAARIEEGLRRLRRGFEGS